MNTLSPQARTVLSHLRTNQHLTAWQAEGVYRIRRLASRVDELRAAGFEVCTEIARDASGQRYTRYSLSRAQKRAKVPLLAPRQTPSQFRIDTVAMAYRRYCQEDLGIEGMTLNEEVAAFTSFLSEFAA